MSDTDTVEYINMSIQDLRQRSDRDPWSRCFLLILACVSALLLTALITVLILFLRPEQSAALQSRSVCTTSSCVVAG